MDKNNIIEFPKNKIVKINTPEKPKGFHQQKIERLLHELSYEFARAIHEKEISYKEEFTYQQILPTDRDDKKFTKLQFVVFSSDYPF
jgi:hypothetical protein